MALVSMLRLQEVVDLLQRALDAHGGLEKWQAAGQVRVRLRSGGRLFDARLQGRTISRATRSGAVVHFSTDVPRVLFEGFPRPGYRAISMREPSASSPVNLTGRCTGLTPGRPSRT